MSNKKLTPGGVIVTSTLAVFLAAPVNLSAQALEEIIVTAQRREQSLQEVPVSISTINSDDIIRQGFREMEDLESFVPSVEIEANLHDTSITIRGMGNDAANLSIEQSAPIFVDGVTYGRGSMINMAFLDVERIEVLNGPQPIAFGQNATAGAFSVTTKKPTEEWEGNSTLELGNFARKNLKAGVGGPINDSWGIRLAGQYDETKGHLTDFYTGEPFPYRRDIVGRVTTVWKASEKFTALFKAEYMRRDSEGDPNMICRSSGNLNPYDESAVNFPGMVPQWDAITADQREVPNCVDGFNRIGFKEGQDYRPSVFPGLPINNSDGRSGTFDISDLVRPLMEQVGVPNLSTEAREPLRVWDFLINLNYDLDNGVQIEANSGMIKYHRETYEDNEADPFYTDSSSRVEQYDMWSQEIRVRSPSGGKLEWEFGGYYQTEALDLDPVLTMRPNLRQGVRLYHPWQDPEWKSAFAAFTFNFLGDKASIDVGGRYTDVHKEGAITAEGATYIFNINPDPDNDGLITSTQWGPGGTVATVRTLRFATTNALQTGSRNIIDCGANPIVPDLLITGGDPNDPRDTIHASGTPCGIYAGVPGYYTSRWNNRETPDPWQGQKPVAVSPLLSQFLDRSGPFHDTLDENSFDPQITLRYRPNGDHSLYFKWAKAFKAGGFDTSDRGMPDGGIGTSLGQDGFSFKAEHAQNFELGARGNLFENRLRYGVTLFNQEIKDLQVETEVVDLASALAGLASTSRGQTNAGKQRTRGIDFDATWAATDNLILKMAGVFQHGTMVQFVGGCTDVEFANADSNDCISIAESTAALGNDSLAGFIDRAGSRAPRTPDWKAIFGADYEHPVFERFKYLFSTEVSISDGYTEDTLGYSEVISWDTHVDWDLNIGIGSLDDAWKVSLWGRNLLGARVKYHPENDVDPRGIEFETNGANDYTTYGVQFGYQF